MDGTKDTAPVFEVLSESELAAIVGGAELGKVEAREALMEKIGMCGCGLAH